jgi:hypothetical protein
MLGGGRRRQKRPVRKVNSLYQIPYVDDDVLEEEEMTLEEMRGRARSTRRLFASVGGEDGGGEDGRGEDGGGKYEGDQGFVDQGGSEATPGESSSSASGKPHQRGITRLPSAAPTLAFRPVIRPDGPK